MLGTHSHGRPSAAWRSVTCFCACSSAVPEYGGLCPDHHVARRPGSTAKAISFPNHLVLSKFLVRLPSTRVRVAKRLYSPTRTVRYVKNVVRHRFARQYGGICLHSIRSIHRVVFHGLHVIRHRLHALWLILERDTMSLGLFSQPMCFTTVALLSKPRQRVATINVSHMS